MKAKVAVLLFPLSFAPAALTRAEAPQSSPAPSSTPAHSEYVEVTATRIPEPADEVPASVTVVTGEELRDRGATTLREALAPVVGVEVAPGADNGPASAVVELSGLKEFDAFLLVVDGIPWGGAFNPGVESVNLNDVERIEVVRGGGGSLSIPLPKTGALASTLVLDYLKRAFATNGRASSGGTRRCARRRRQARASSESTSTARYWTRVRRALNSSKAPNCLPSSRPTPITTPRERS